MLVWVVSTRILAMLWTRYMLKDINTTTKSKYTRVPRLVSSRDWSHEQISSLEPWHLYWRIKSLLLIHKRSTDALKYTSKDWKLSSRSNSNNILRENIKHILLYASTLRRRNKKRNLILYSQKKSKNFEIFLTTKRPRYYLNKREMITSLNW